MPLATLKSTRSTYTNGDTKNDPAHYRLAPSSSNRWLACPYSAQSNLPDTAGPAAKAGTIGHRAAQEYLESPARFNPLFLLEVSVYDAVAPYVGPAKADDIATATAYYAEHVAALPGEHVYESKIRHPTIPDFGGTVDTGIIDGDTLGIVDFKSGFWEVAAEGNTQLQCYLILGRHKFGRFPNYTAQIVQPRVKTPVKTAAFTNAELDTFEVLVGIAAKSERVNAGEHCRFCPLRPTCEPGTMYAIGAGW